MTSPPPGNILTIEQAWRKLCDVLVYKNPGRVRSSRRALRYVRRMQARR